MYTTDKNYVFHNGAFLKAKNNGASFYSQALHYGYAAFEGIRAYGTEHGIVLFKAKEHFKRFFRSAEALDLEIPYSYEELIEASHELLHRNNLTDAYVRPLVYGGDQMGLVPSQEPKVLIVAFKWKKYYHAPHLNLHISPYHRLKQPAFHGDGKISGYYVNSILATRKAKAAGYDEALMLDDEGYIAQGPSSNFFFEKNDKLYTPEKGNILPGITRKTIIQLAKEIGIEVVEGKFKPEELEGVKGAFLTGTAVEVVPIQSIEGNKMTEDFDHTMGKMLANNYRKLVNMQEPEIIYF
ncbi:MAG: branched-chain amino acid transaminase [Chitinophagales bacterium]